MAYDGNGIFSFPFLWTNDASNGIPITASRMDTQFSNATQGFDLCVTRDNQGKPSATMLPDTTSVYDLGGTTNQWANLYLSGGITFNNGLPFSETIESWTPTDSSGGGLSIASSAGYTRQGNIITAYAQIVYPVNADSGHSAFIGGLPVVAPNVNYAQQGGLTFSTTSAAAFVQINKNTSGFGIYGPSGAPITNAALSGATIDVCMVYPAS